MILEEVAYVDPGFFYETVAPLLIVGMTTLIGISTLTSEINFYTRLFKLRDEITGAPIFLSMSVELACQHCKDEGNYCNPLSRILCTRLIDLHYDHATFCMAEKCFFGGGGHAAPLQ